MLLVITPHIISDTRFDIERWRLLLIITNIKNIFATRIWSTCYNLFHFLLTYFYILGGGNKMNRYVTYSDVGSKLKVGEGGWVGGYTYQETRFNLAPPSPGSYAYDIWFSSSKRYSFRKSYKNCTFSFDRKGISLRIRDYRRIF